MFTKKDTFNPILNPSDEKLREMIAEKDAEIERLKMDNINLKAIRPSFICECSGELYCQLQVDNARLKQDAERYRKLRRMLTISTPERFDAFVDAAQEVQS